MAVACARVPVAVVVVDFVVSRHISVMITVVEAVAQTAL